MKTIYKIIPFFIIIFSSAKLFAQPVGNIVKQTQGINSIFKVTANNNARIHANSNSVFGTSSNHSNNRNKDQTKKNEIKVDKESKKNTSKKQKNNRESL